MDTKETRSWRMFRWQLVAVVALFAATIYGGSQMASADHESNYINLTTLGATETHNGAVYLQAQAGAGTGNWDPFLTFNVGGSTPTEKGYNSDGPAQFDEFYGGDRTKPLPLASIPFIEVGGTLYREFGLDSNDACSEDFMSIDELKVFVDNQSNLTDYDESTEIFGNDDDAEDGKIFDQGDGVYVLMQSCLSSGSGVSDIVVRIPDTAFNAPDCYYGSLTCGLYVYLWTAMGGLLDDEDEVEGDQNWGTTGGFEEWQTRLLPVVNVTKTAEVSVNRNYTWTVDKKVNIDGGDCENTATASLFEGESQDAEWCIVATRSAGTLSGGVVSGTITIHNPTDNDIFPVEIPAKISDIVDDIDFSSLTDQDDITLDCGTFDEGDTLGAGDTLECTYSVPAAGATATETGTNYVTVELEYTVGTGQNAVTLNVEYEAEDDFDFGDPENVTETNETAQLTDDELGLDKDAVSGQVESGVVTYDCDDASTTNTATVTPDDGGPIDTDDATLTVTCYDLDVTKTATTTFSRTYLWTIEKTVTPDEWDLFRGESGTSEYTVTVNGNGSTDSNWAVSGNITIFNNHPTRAADLNSVTDVITAGLNATVNCGGATSVPANDDLVCTYSRSLPDATARTNTATATQQLYNFDEDGVASDDGTEQYSDDADVTFDNTPDAEVNATVNITDTVQGSLGPCTTATAPCVDTYTRTFTCDADEGTKNNTATITETGQNDSASVDIDCYELTVTKTTTETFTRTYEWEIEKTSDCSELDLLVGEVYDDCDYDVTVTVDNGTDSLWRVTGNITIANSHPTRAAELTTVADVVAAGLAATVDCGGVTSVPAADDIVCTYSRNLPDAATRLNTATATQQLYDFDEDLVPTADGTQNYSGTANVVFPSTPTTIIDECVDVTDTVQGVLGSACVADSPKTFSYSIVYGPFTSADCGENEFPNTASFETNDTGATGDDTVTVIINVECATGCTLTQGYWKTHSSKGPAKPADPTWDLLGDLDGDGTSEGEDEDFFNSNVSWYDVFWTAPKGNFSYNLAHQYMAAYLNQLAGADSTAAVDAAMATAEAWFEANTGAYGLKKPTNAQKQTLTGPHGILGSYNEGDIGPGHCSEDEIADSANSAYKPS